MHWPAPELAATPENVPKVVRMPGRTGGTLRSSLTGRDVLPPGSHRDLTDPYAQSHKGRNRLTLLLVLLVVLVAAWYFGTIERVLPGVLPKSGWVEKRETAAQPPPSPPAAGPAAPVEKK